MPPYHFYSHYFTFVQVPNLKFLRNIVSFLRSCCEYAFVGKDDGTLSIELLPNAPVSKAMLEPSAAFSLFGLILEYLPITIVESLWELIEADLRTMQKYVDDSFGTQSRYSYKARLSLLQMSSNLLRRLSRSRDTVMYGKILLFLAFMLPLSERSGVNITGTINTESQSSYDGIEEDMALIQEAGSFHPTQPSTETAPAPKQKGATPAAPSVLLDGRYYTEKVYNAVRDAYKDAPNVIHEDAASVAFYRTFWRLQVFAYSPNLATASIEAWNLFVGTLRTVVRVWEEHDIVLGVAKPLDTHDATAADLSQVSFESDSEDEEGQITDKRSTKADSKSSKAGKDTKKFSHPPAFPSLALVTSDLSKSSSNDSSSTNTSASSRAKTNASSTSNGTSSHTSPALGAIADSSVDSGENLKYLTDWALLPLELRDASLRIRLCVQMLVLLQHFTLSRPGPRDSVPAAVRSKMQEEVPLLRSLLTEVLSRVRNEGMRILASVELLLQTEQFWIQWKQRGAKKYEKAIPSPAEDSAAKEVSPSPAAFMTHPFRPSLGMKGVWTATSLPRGPTTPVTLPPTSPYAYRSGQAKALPKIMRHCEVYSSALSQHYLERVLDPQNGYTPTAPAYFVPMRLACEPEMDVEPEAHPKVQERYKWVGNRLLSRTTLHPLAAMVLENLTFEEAVGRALGIAFPEIVKEEEKLEMMEEDQAEEGLAKGSEGEHEDEKGGADVEGAEDDFEAYMAKAAAEKQATADKIEEDRSEIEGSSGAADNEPAESETEEAAEEAQEPVVGSKRAREDKDEDEAVAEAESADAAESAVNMPHEDSHVEQTEETDESGLVPEESTSVAPTEESADVEPDVDDGDGDNDTSAQKRDAIAQSDPESPQETTEEAFDDVAVPEPDSVPRAAKAKRARK